VLTQRLGYFRRVLAADLTSIRKRDLRSTSVATCEDGVPAQQIPFPVTGHRAIFYFSRPLADTNRIGDLVTK